MKSASITTVSIAVMAALSFPPMKNASAESSRSQRQAAIRVQSCLEKAADHFDYSAANRVVHWVDDMNQRNLLTTVVRIRTDVYSRIDGVVVQKYETHCATDTFGKVISIRVDDRPAPRQNK